MQQQQPLTTTVTTPPDPPFQTRWEKMGVWVSRLVGFLFFIGVMYLIFVVIHVLRVDCPFVNGRRCNDRGVCGNGGLCECEVLYSGIDCADTLVPGYDPETNQECNGHGFANPFINIPASCQAVFVNGEYQTGTGWIAPLCVSYVQAAQQLISTSTPEALPDLSITVPLCFCYPGFVGQSCLQSGCPTDLIGRICGGNGNTSVGIIQNFTNAGAGCQCQNVVALYEPQYRALFTSEALENIKLFYDTDFNYRTYCGRVYSITGPDNDTVENRLIFSTSESDYKCYCQQDWAGRTCTVGRCPYNRNTGKICNGNGADHLGQGIILNTPIKNTTNGLCDIICKDGWEKCFNSKDRCIYQQNSYEQLFDPGVLCQSQLQCPDEAPLRAYTGGCYRIPPVNGGSAQNCFAEYQQAVIDYSQFNQSVLAWKCPNITSFEELNVCFENTTELTGITGYYPLGGGGVYLNGSVTTSWFIDLGSPLLYFQFESTGPVRINNWDGQVFDFQTAGFHSQSINYETEGEWILRDISAPINLLRLPENLYQLYPIQIFNYSILQIFDPNVTYIQIINTDRQVTYVLDTVNSNVEVIPYAPGVTSTYPNIGLLIRSPFNAADQVNEFWYFPSTGELVSRAACLGNAALCAWYYNETSGQVFNLERTLFVCNTTTFIADVECAFELDDYYQQIDAFRWYTSIQARSRIPLTALVAQFDTLYTNLSDAFRFTGFQIVFSNTTQAVDTLFTSPSFLTKARTRYDCVVPPSSLDTNQTILNEIWWGQTIQRQVILSRVDLQSDYFLGAVFSQGQKQLFRTRAVSVNEAAQTMKLRDLSTGVIFSAHVRDVRTLQPLEVLRGWPQADTLRQPYRCPDGSATAMTSTQREIPTSCNCTFSTPVANCNCTDDMNINWGCQCDLSTPECICGNPATFFFQQGLLERLQGFTTDSCECLFFTPSIEDLANSSVTLTSVSSDTVQFNQNLNQIPTNIIFTTNSSTTCDTGLINITQGSILFFNLTPSVNYTATVTTISTGNCEYWVTLYADQFLAFTNINLTINDGGVINWATMLYSTYGIGLMHTSDIPTFTASSNSVDAPNVNVLNSSYWLSSGSLREYPVWIKASFEYNHFVSLMRIVFYEAGTVHGSGTEIPLQVQVQGWNSMGWTPLAQFGVYVLAGGWEEMLVNITTGNITFSQFRLVAPGGRMGIRQWEIYTNQDCYCENGTWLAMNIQNTDGLVDLTSTLEDINYFLDSVATENCVCKDNCTIQISPGIYKNVSNDGFCNDVFFTNSVNGIETQLVLDGEFNFTYTVDSGVAVKLFTWGLFTGQGSIQFSNDSSGFMTLGEQQEYVTQSLAQTIGQQSIPVFYNGSNPNSQFYLLNLTTLELLYTPFGTTNSNITVSTYLNDTFIINNKPYDYDWGIFLEQGTACEIGWDCSDCGPVRSVPFMQGYTCSLTPFQQKVLGHVTNGNVLLNRTYYLGNMTQLTSFWFASLQNINLTRTQVQVVPSDCEEQVCSDATLPVLCKNGTCVEFPGDCDDRYNCPGNGCVELTDGALGEGSRVYQCACKVGFNGDACEFGRCLPATPLIPPAEGGTPAGEECSVDPPLTQVTSGVNLRTGDITTAEVEVINNRISGVVAPRSALDIGPHNVKWLHNPFGRKISRKVEIPVPGFAPTVFWTTCPFYRKGRNGAKFTLLDDVISQNFTTGEKTWRVEEVDGVNVTYEWTNFTRWDDFPWRCANGICNENENFCAQSNLQFQICNGRGWGRADGSCECYPGWKTFSINTGISNKIAVPYPVINNISQPTLMVIDDTWRHWSLTQCTARDCEAQDCQNLKGCYSGTSEVGFVDKLVPCPQGTGRFGFCAPSIRQCITGSGLQAALECSGNGIPRVKDITGERYCFCGNPISPLQNVSAVSQITQLRSNGWGGPTCADYAAPSAPLIWSTYNYELDTPWRSLITGEILPGVWLSGIAPAGPSPDDLLLWRQCCPTGRLEACNCVPCRVNSDRGRIQLLEPQECLIVGVPLIYRCNNHGLARADGTCECEVDEQDGSGYTYDLTEFSVKGCFKFVQCPISPVNNAPCHRIDALASPGEWLHPLPKDDFLEQQWLTCGLNGQGMYSNITKMQEISVNTLNFGDLIQDSLAQIALEVISAINGLSGCICVYPNDTQTSKCCMITNDVELQYEQNFNTPYLLSGIVPGDGNLTDGTLEALRTIAPFSTFSSNFTFVLDVKNLTSLSAIRMFSAAANGTVVNVKNSAGGVVCAEAIIQGNNGSYFDWNYGADQGASQCGPTFTCQNTRDFADYLANCEFDKQSTRCLEWKRAQCIAEDVNNVYWPPDSLNSYLGCSRNGTDPDGCQCCQKDILTQLAQVLTDGVVNFTISAGGPLYVNQIQLYGFTNRTLTPPSYLQTEVNTISNSNGSECHDELYFRANLGADRSYYIPLDVTPGNDLMITQRPRTRVNAQLRCNETGGWLAVTDNTVDQNDIDALSQICGDFSQTAVCMVAAKDPVNVPTLVGRTELFSDTCTQLYGCYMPLLAATQYVTDSDQRTVYTFSNYDPTNVTYTTPVITGQLSASLNRPRFVYSYNTGGVVCEIKVSLDGITYYTFRSMTDMDFFGLGVSLSTGRFPNGRTFSNWGFMKIEPYGCAVLAFHGTPSYSNPIYRDTQSNTNYNEGAPKFVLVPSGYDRTILNSFPGIFVYEYSAVVNMITLYSELSSFYCPTTNGFCLLSYPFYYPSIKPFPPVPGVIKYAVNYMHNQRDQGTQGADFMPGRERYPYRPLFLRLTSDIVIDPIIGDVDFTVVSNYNLTISFPNETVPIFLKEADNEEFFRLCPNLTRCMIPATDIVPKCSDCLNSLRGQIQWDDRLYSSSVWRGSISTYPTPELFVKGYLFTRTLDNINSICPLGPGSCTTSVAAFTNNITTYIPLSRLLEYSQISTSVVTNTGNVVSFIYPIFYSPQTYAHQISYIVSRTTRPNPPFVEWSINNCVIVTGNSTTIQLEFCDEVVRNFICQYDYTKYVVVPGYQCPDCGPSLKRVGGVPLPGRTCQEQFPLASPEDFPFEHRVKDEYLRGTLTLFAESFNLQPNITDDFRNHSIIWGFTEAWLKWKGCFSSQPGLTTRGVKANVNWCNMCPSLIWPFDCGIRVNPYTNIREHRLATSEEFCDPQLVNFTNTAMNNQSIPDQVLAVLASNSYEDSTCGVNVPLRSYFRQDKYGGIQSDLSLEQQIIRLDFFGVELESIESTLPLKWFNAGKAPQPYTFQWNQTASIYGEYVLNNCPLCTDAMLEVYLHPLDPGYVPPVDIISVFVSISNTNPGDARLSYLVNYTVTSAETGVLTIDGEDFPLVVFQGVGYRVHNLTVGATFALFNPVITNSETRLDCTTRPTPDWREPLNAIKSTAPIRECIISISDQEQYPGSVVGDCNCDISTSGASCSVPATISKYGKSGCGGYGQPGATIIAPNGQRYLTGELGGFVWDGHIDCKTFDLGRVGWTTVVPGAIWEYKSVYPPKAPRNGAPVFSRPPNQLLEQLDLADVTLDCQINQALVAYYYTSDELTQLLRLTQNTYPIFMSVDTLSVSGNEFPWDSPVSGALFSNESSFLVIGDSGSCGTDASVCTFVNFNNYVFNKTFSTVPLLTDGDTSTDATITVGADIDWFSSPPLQGTSVQVWVFLTGTEAGTLITCTDGGTCSKQLGAGFSHYYNCNCATRRISYATSTKYTEIQVFGLFDLSRSQFYTYF